VPCSLSGAFPFLYVLYRPVIEFREQNLDMTENEFKNQ
jgi:hypothetical protein